ncbi:formin isoform X7 [Denticeps clupeoides]|uniref:formin isoform X7 n=1 Tax=Denticeps clupeoides TaxID=299321 RepID=UPI0010A46C67|nr:formin-1 isoform X7 [Denticeps clupeoides]
MDMDTKSPSNLTQMEKAKLPDPTEDKVLMFFRSLSEKGSQRKNNEERRRTDLEIKGNIKAEIQGKNEDAKKTLDKTDERECLLGSAVALEKQDLLGSEYQVQANFSNSFNETVPENRQDDISSELLEDVSDDSKNQALHMNTEEYMSGASIDTNSWNRLSDDTNNVPEQKTQEISKIHQGRMSDNSSSVDLSAVKGHTKSPDIDIHYTPSSPLSETSAFDQSAALHTTKVVITLTRLQPVPEEPDPQDKTKATEDDSSGQKENMAEEDTKDATGEELVPGSQPEATSSVKPASTSVKFTLSPRRTPTVKPVQLPALFGGLTKKGATGKEKEAVARLTRPVRESLFSDLSPIRSSPPKGPTESKGSVLDQISQLLNLDSNKTEEKEKSHQEPVVENQKDSDGTQHDQDTNTEKEDETPEDNKKATGAESAFEAFKAFFTPKPMKKPDIDQIKDRMRSDREAFKALFERASTKTPEKKNLQCDVSSPGDGEERTPGRLQAIWPPPKPKDHEEKVGLKYTEAEHQTALLYLKRECKEEVEQLNAKFELKLFQLRGEHAETVSELERALADLQRDTKEASRGSLKDASVSTEDDASPKTFRTVCIQTDRETFIKPNEEEEGKDILKTAHHNVPKKIDIASLNLGLTAKTETDEEPVPSPSSSPETVETTSSVLSGNTTLAPPPDSLTPNPVTSNVSSPTSQALEGPLLRPPPPPALAGGPPLPPPPAQGGMPLPPPPPPPGVGFTQSTPVEKPPRKPAVEPSCPMKPLYWTRIQIQDVNNDTLWSSLKEPPLLNASEFEDLFSKAALQTKRKPLSGTSEKKAKAKKLVKLLDGKRSQAVGILISSLHLEMKDIRQAVLTGDSSVVDLETIEALYESRALPEELERLKKHYETADKEHIAMLDKPEQFLYELSQIPDFSGRARCLIFQSVFTEGITSIKRKVENVLSVCEALLHRQSVRDIMGLVLVLGNYMNGGNRTRGQADGFGLEILPKLKDVKSRDNRISLVDFVVSYYLHNLDQMAGMDKSIFPLPEPQEVFLAAQVKFEDLNNDLRKLGRDLADCEKDVQTACSHSSEEHLHPFKEKMEAFVSNAQQDYSITNHHLRSAQKNFYELVDYFGMKPRAGEKQVVPSQVFMLWFEFCGDFKTRWKRESKSISKERLKEAQQSVRNITAEKKVETRTIHANGLKERLRQKEANMATS